MYDAAMKHRNITDRNTISQHRQQSGADQSVGDIEARAHFGPDDCGKTTHLGAIAGVHRHVEDGGRNLLGGEDIPGIMSMNERARVSIGFAFRRSEGWRRGISSTPPTCRRMWTGFSVSWTWWISPIGMSTEDFRAAR